MMTTIVAECAKRWGITAEKLLQPAHMGLLTLEWRMARRMAASRLKDAGYSWTQIGDALGVSKVAAYYAAQRYGERL